MTDKDQNSYDIQEYLVEYLDECPDKEIRIINAAINAFSEKGYSNTKTKEIAERAGIAEGTIFRYFTAKEAILERMVPLLIRVLKPKLEKPIQNIINDQKDAPVSEIFSAILYDRLKVFSDNRRFLKSVLPELIYRAPLLEQLKESVLPLINKYISKVLEEGKRRGEIAKDVETKIATQQLFGFILSHTLLCVDEDEKNLQVDVDTFVHYIMKGWQYHG